MIPVLTLLSIIALVVALWPRPEPPPPASPDEGMENEEPPSEGWRK